MPIEQLMQELKQEVQTLRAELAAMRDGLDFDQKHQSEQQSEPVAVPDQEPENQPEEESEPSEETDEQPTRQDVSNLCLSMTREGKVSKKVLLEIIGEFDGARSVKEVPEASIPDLYARLKEQG